MRSEAVFLALVCTLCACSVRQPHHESFVPDGYAAAVEISHGQADAAAAVREVLLADGFRVAAIGGRVKANRRVVLGDGGVELLGSTYPVVMAPDFVAGSPAVLRLELLFVESGDRALLAGRSTGTGFAFSSHTFEELLADLSSAAQGPESHD
ncbi:MAG: hypothetical protein ACE5D3_01910 [Candidatus Binatia bacterium]